MTDEEEMAVVSVVVVDVADESLAMSSSLSLEIGDSEGVLVSETSASVLTFSSNFTSTSLRPIWLRV